MKHNTILLTSVLTILLITARYSEAQWVTTGGPEGGQITSLLVLDSTIFAGAMGGGVYLSTNSGLSWAIANRGLSIPAISCFATDGMNVYAGTNGGYKSEPGAVFRTTDQGATWSATAPANMGWAAYAIVNVGSNLFVGADNGVFRSTDSGSSWVEANTDLPLNNSVDALVALGSELFAGTSGAGVFRSTDSGAHWFPVTGGLPQTSFHSFAVNGSIIFAGTQYGGLFRSSDSGRTWLNRGIGSYSDPDIISLAINGTTLLAGTRYDGLFTSSDSGSTWSSAGNFRQLGAYAIAVKNGQTFVGTGYGGVLRSNRTDTNWTTLNTGLTNTYVSCMGTKDDTLIVGSDGYYTTVDRGGRWTVHNTGLPTHISVTGFATMGTDCFLSAGYNGRGVFHSTDGGATWNSASTGLPLHYMVLSMGSFDSDLFVGVSDSGLYRSTDMGLTWVGSRSGIKAAYVPMCYAHLDTTLFVGTAWGGLYRSNDHGATWFSSGVGITSKSVQALQTVGTTIFAGTTDAGVFRSTDTGNTWIKLDSGLTDLIVKCFAYSNGALFAGTTNGEVFRTTDGGLHWIELSTGLQPFNDILALVASRGDLFAATSGSGVWRRPLSELGTSAGSQRLPSMPLISSFPNPSTGRATVRFSPKQPSHAEISILNLLGAHVAELFAGQLAPGDHSFTWDARNLPSGTYMCVVRTNGVVQSMPIIVSH